MLNSTRRAVRRLHLRVADRLRRRARMAPIAGVAAKLGTISVSPVTDPGDQAFVVYLKQLYAQRHGLPYVAWDQGVQYFVAKRILTGERLGCCAVNQLGPLGRFFIGDFFVIDGKAGKEAAIAMLEVLHGAALPILGLIDVRNEKMLDAVTSHYGYRVVGYLVEGPGAKFEEGT